MNPLAEHTLDELRRCFDGSVQIVKDLGSKVLVFGVPTGCRSITLRQYLESRPKEDDCIEALDWLAVRNARAPFLLLVDPAQSGPSSRPQ